MEFNSSMSMKWVCGIIVCLGSGNTSPFDTKYYDNVQK